MSPPPKVKPSSPSDRWLRSGAAALVAALLTGCTVPTTLDTDKTEHKLAGTLDWLAKNSQYTSPAPIARWVQQSREQMIAHHTRLGVSGNDRNPYAGYDCRAKTLYLWSGANLDDAIVTSFVLHAVAHQQQCAADKGLEACAAETEASALQAKFVRGLPAMMKTQGYEADDGLLASIEGVARQVEANALFGCQVPPASK